MTIKEEFELWSNRLMISIHDGGKREERFYPSGRIDILCMDSLGNLCIIDVKCTSPGNLKWDIHAPNRKPKYKFEKPFQGHAVQVEMYALVFDFLAKLHNIPLRIAYTGILYYYAESIQANGKGFARFIKIKRNPKQILTDEVAQKSIIGNLKQVY